MVEMVSLLQTKGYEQVKPPVFIDFSPEYAREHGLSRDIDRRVQKPCGTDSSDKLDMKMYNNAVAASLSPKEALGWIAVAKAVVELMIYGYDELVRRRGEKTADMAQGALMMAMAEASEGNKLDAVA